ncbi:MAG TPA: hypothetical protein VNZ86_01600, partial [Bacteroidia bacterium]|nr:hypothetical protein [Bacteroidia bacterium]
MLSGITSLLKHSLFLKLMVALGLILLSVMLYLAFQEPDVYSRTLGRITHTYQHAGTGRNVKIVEVNEAFADWKNESVYHWDAALYEKIRVQGYKTGAAGAKEKLAFYPLFPWVWNITRLGPHGIIILNALLFVSGILMLLYTLQPAPENRFFYFLLALLVPTAVEFYLPYAEALFLFTLAIAVWGILKSNYKVFAAGAFFFCMTRPSALIFMMALLATDGIFLFRHRNWRHFMREFGLKIAPCIAGFLVVTGIQYSFTGSWDSYFDSLDLWPSESGLFNTIRDWSREGFGMSVFSIFFVCIPALVYILIWALQCLFGKQKQEALSFLGADPVFKRDYLWYVSLVFISGNLIYTILVSGNCINGFSRYTLAVPFFYIVLFQLPERLRKLSVLQRMLVWTGSCAGLILFLTQVFYGGSRFTFAFLGM